MARGGLWHRAMVEAEAFALNHTPAVGCRTLDILHVAAAKLIGTTEFCTFDAPIQFGRSSWTDPRYSITRGLQFLLCQIENVCQENCQKKCQKKIVLDYEKHIRNVQKGNAA